MHPWTYQKLRGDVGETRIKEMLHQAGLQVVKTTGRCTFDMTALKRVGHRTIPRRIEVKSDFIAPRTGNLAIETHESGNPSGLSICTASWYAFVLPEHAVFVATPVLRRMVRSGQYATAMGGYRNTARLVLIPSAELELADTAHLVNWRDEPAIRAIGKWMFN